MDHDYAKQRAGHRADLLVKSFEVAGPDLMTLLRKPMEMLTTAGDAEVKTPEAEGASSQGSDQALPRAKTKTATARETQGITLGLLRSWLYKRDREEPRFIEVASSLERVEAATIELRLGEVLHIWTRRKHFV